MPRNRSLVKGTAQPLEGSRAFYERVAHELLRAIRGKRSQVALARRLGYSGNPVTDWERGVRHPTAKEVLRVAAACRLPVREAFLVLVPLEPPILASRSGKAGGREWVIHPWLAALRGSLSNTELAQRLGISRYTVSRWCSGDTDIKLHELLLCIHALTGRVHDWVAGLVPIAQVPSLTTQFEQATAARNVAVEQPWTEAILRVLETQSYREYPAIAHSTLAATLGISDVTLQQALDGLTHAAIVSRQEDPSTGQVYYEALRELSVDTRTHPNAIRTLQQHWLEVALERSRRGEQDWFAYNVFSCSRSDLARVKDCLKRGFRESRSVIATSSPNERAGLVLMQLVEW
jgi:transcriptional regulator with XRE-family HTH domain